MPRNKNLVLGKIFKDTNGRVVLWQWPNVPLWGWIILKLFALVVAQGHLRSVCEQLGTVLLFTWAYLELTRGINYFRRALGLAVLIAIILSYLKR